MESNPLATQAQQQSKKPRRTIALEEHYATPAFWEGPGRQLRNQSQSANPQAASQAARIVDQAGVYPILGPNGMRFFTLFEGFIWPLQRPRRTLQAQDYLKLHVASYSCIPGARLLLSPGHPPAIRTNSGLNILLESVH